MSETTFENSKVGDRVWSIEWGWGNIKEIYDLELNKKMFVRFKTAGFNYFLNGKWIEDSNQTLFWDEIKIVPPERPKRKVVKFVRRYGVYTKNGDVLNTFRDKADAHTFSELTGGIVVELTGKLEVEE